MGNKYIIIRLSPSKWTLAEWNKDANEYKLMTAFSAKSSIQHSNLLYILHTLNIIGMDQYLANTAIEQAQEIARAAHCDLYIDNTTLAITPKGMARNANSIPLISKDTGLVGYPTFDSNGVVFRMLFDPRVKWGGIIQLQSDLTAANGQWIVLSMSYRLESERPGGEWFATVRGFFYGS